MSSSVPQPRLGWRLARWRSSREWEWRAWHTLSSSPPFRSSRSYTSRFSCGSPCRTFLRLCRLPFCSGSFSFGSTCLSCSSSMRKRSRRLMQGTAGHTLQCFTRYVRDAPSFHSRSLPAHIAALSTLPAQATLLKPATSSRRPRKPQATLFIFGAWMYYIYFVLKSDILDLNCCRLPDIIPLESTGQACLASTDATRNGVTVANGYQICQEDALAANGVTSQPATPFSTLAMSTTLSTAMSASGGSSWLLGVVDSALLGYFAATVMFLLFLYEQMKVKVCAQRSFDTIKSCICARCVLVPKGSPQRCVDL
mmetsp:Transcript_27666/g.67440  ORF Transcript_27666/g.67440 Transcript_27666/m.67440 type:complete len:310 (+) Transcript_27666:1481-2410(+)